MTRKPFILLIPILTFIYTSCNKVSPAGFWNNYKKELLINEFIDQGPYGGHRAMHWKNNKKNTFNSGAVLEFASKNGWTLVDSAAFNHDHTRKWVYDNKPIFPLSHTGLSDTAKSISTYENFPRWFGGQIKVYRLRTGWMSIDPGTDNSIEENGFIIINNAGTEMAVYHLWGE